MKNSSGTELSKIVYGWDKDDLLTSKTTTGTAGAGTNTYGYDRAGRLTSWTAPGGAVTAYEWDASGNRTKAGAETFVYDQRNRLTSGAGTDYTYTPRGTTATETKAGVTRNLTFDAFDRLVNDGDASYGYDALGRMTSRTKGADQQRFTYSGLSNDLVATTDGAGALQAKYGRDPFGGLLSLQEGAGPALATMTDLHGDLVATFSGTALVDSTAYDPFGNVTHRSGTQRALGYQGEYTDPDTGKVNMHARWYQPGTGAFTSRDTATLNPDPSVQANRYTYANASPLTHSDPTGHSSIQINNASSITGTTGSSSWQSFDMNAYMSAHIDKLSAKSFDVTKINWPKPGQPYNAWGGDGSGLYRSDGLPDWEPWNPGVSNDEAQRIGYMTNGRPAPKGYWNESKEVRDTYMSLYSIYKDDADMAKTWSVLKKIDKESKQNRASSGSPYGGKASLALCVTCKAGSNAGSKKNIPPPPKDDKDANWLQWLSQAGVCATHGMVKCGQIAAISAYAAGLTSGIKDSNKANAIRHFVWMAGMATVVGEAAALDFAKAHEAGTGRKKYGDSLRDQLNNIHSMKYEKNHRGELQAIYWTASVGAGITTVMNHLAIAGSKEYNAGRMAILVSVNKHEEQVWYGGRIVWRGKK
ncbi:RHS repeat domain-containing protein [Streptosporangium amethystogenes subsp. fukuiense]|uniref:RHS repeat domain-containing protein n=1 Tax=Streptosporangium amethystogenes subsp. fukuiense TaxID=698418 RepID=A0ABW2TF44_9ACTN